MATVLEIVGLFEEDRLKALLDEARAATGEPQKPSVKACLAWAIRTLGYETASVSDATDDEAAAVPAAKLDALLDLTELRALESIQSNLTQVTNQTGPVRDDWNDLSRRVTAMVEDRRKSVSAQHGVYLARPLTGEPLRKASIRAL